MTVDKTSGLTHDLAASKVAAKALLISCADSSVPQQLVLEAVHNLLETLPSECHSLAANVATSPILDKVGSTLKDALNIRAEDSGGTPLLFAVSRGLLEVVFKLLGLGADAGGSYFHPSGNGVLHIAAMHGHVECVRALLSKCTSRSGSAALLEMKNSNGDTPLHFACYKGNMVAAGLMLKAAEEDNVEEEHSSSGGHEVPAAGATCQNVGTTGTHQTMTSYVKQQHHQAFSTSLGNSSGTAQYHPHPLVMLEDKRGSTALHYACRSGHVDCVKALLDAGASTLVRNASGFTPLLEIRKGLQQVTTAAAASSLRLVKGQQKQALEEEAHAVAQLRLRLEACMELLEKRDSVCKEEGTEMRGLSMTVVKGHSTAGTSAETVVSTAGTSEATSRGFQSSIPCLNPRKEVQAAGLMTNQEEASADEGLKCNKVATSAPIVLAEVEDISLDRVKMANNMDAHASGDLLTNGEDARAVRAVSQNTDRKDCTRLSSVRTGSQNHMSGSGFHPHSADVPPQDPDVPPQDANAQENGDNAQQSYDGVAEEGGWLLAARKGKWKQSYDDVSEEGGWLLAARKGKWQQILTKGLAAPHEVLATLDRARQTRRQGMALPASHGQPTGDDGFPENAAKMTLVDILKQAPVPQKEAADVPGKVAYDIMCSSEATEKMSTHRSTSASDVGRKGEAMGHNAVTAACRGMEMMVTEQPHSGLDTLLDVSTIGHTVSDHPQKLAASVLPQDDRQQPQWPASLVQRIEKDCPWVLELAVQPAHLLGEGLEDLSMAQLDALELLHHIALARIAQVRLNLVREQERVIATEEAHRELEIERRRIAMQHSLKNG
ncbi:hypothetical protein CEUSTIGMA_g791.t1 [Chlamydomonas eustigma]|uniref:Uncharacterized protein n=1 Tax=Chlamydomonas eustigma TaxID=1157962 RepID=A0A250WR72_9CHLO|nr:hypothetical protein CEUSTIGMA_g791.t1 [Chlamydomonas eustigma]|eukprot:GAX73337.1 hypothetical protein CEUSTIGMA_g791.t1 [Chlamydomonas eustigma]